MPNGVLTIPSPQKKYAWVSAVEEGPYHVETNASAANGGNSFRALCGATGPFNCYLPAGRIFQRQKCATCQQLSTSGILDIGVAPQGQKELSDGSIRSEVSGVPGMRQKRGENGSCIRDQRLIGNQQSAQEVQGTRAANNELHISGKAGCVLGVAPQKIEFLTKSCHRVSTSTLFERTVSLIVDREALEALRLEDIEAEREGGDIEASGYPDPAESRC